MREIPNADDVALAIVLCSRALQVDPERTLLKGTRARHMSLRLLMQVFPHCSKARMARSVGYVGHMCNVAASPSYNKMGFNVDGVLDGVCREYKEILQNRARMEEEAKVLVKMAQVELDLPEFIVDRQGNLSGPEHPPVKLKGSVQVTAPVLNPKRRSMEDELREAILNTGGRLVKKPV